MYCKGCKTELNQDAKFCHKCGNSLPKEEVFNSKLLEKKILIDEESYDVSEIGPLDIGQFWSVNEVDYRTIINMGLYNMTSKEQILSAKYSDISRVYETKIWDPDVQDGEGICALYILSAYVDNISDPYLKKYGYYWMDKDILVEPRYDFINPIIRRAHDDFVMQVCLEELCDIGDEDDEITTYKIAIINLQDEIIKEYYTEDYNQTYFVLDNNVYFFIQKGNQLKIEDMKGDILLSFNNISSAKYKYDHTRNKSYFIVTNMQGKKALFDIKGKAIFPFGLFDDFTEINDGVILVKKDGKWGFVDEQGKILIPLMYEKITDSYKINEEPTILAYPFEGPTWFYINYKNETDGGKSAYAYIAEYVKG